MVCIIFLLYTVCFPKGTVWSPWLLYAINSRGNVPKYCVCWIRNYERHIPPCCQLKSVISTLVRKAMHIYLSFYFGSKILIPISLHEWTECSLIIGIDFRVQAFSLILDSLVGLSAGIQSAGDLVSGNPGSNPAFSRGRNFSPFDLNIAYLCQSIAINNKHAHRLSQVRKTTGRGVELAECSLMIGTGCRVQVFSLILDSSVGLSADIQSAGDLVSETLGSNTAFSRERQLVSDHYVQG